MTRTQAPGLDLGGWEPHTVVEEMLVDPVPVAALQALLDDGLPPVASGDALPPLWHWVALPSWSPSSELREDGQSHVLLDRPGEELRGKIERAVRLCPRQAIKIVEDA